MRERAICDVEHIIFTVCEKYNLISNNLSAILVCVRDDFVLKILVVRAPSVL